MKIELNEITMMQRSDDNTITTTINDDDGGNNDNPSSLSQHEIIPIQEQEQAEPRSRSNMFKNIVLLSGMWGMGLGAAFVQIPSAQNVLTSNNYDAISTIPLGIIILGSSPMAIVVPKLMHRLGEKRVFLMAAGFGVLGALIQMTGVLLSHNSGSSLEIVFLMVGAAVQSFTYAATNNIRFAVATFATPDFLPKATAFVILGGVVGALLGPLLTNTTRTLFASADYAGNFLQLAIMYFVYGVLASVTDFPPPPPSRAASAAEKGETTVMIATNHCDDNNTSNELDVGMEEGTTTPNTTPNNNSVDNAMHNTSSTKKERSMKEILMTTDLVLLIFVQSMSYNIMAMYMGDIKFPMQENGYNDDQTTYAIFAHQLGMFVPSLISGHVIGVLGVWPTTCIGFLIMLGAGGLFYINTSLIVFYVGITIVGVGWNFSFVGPSSALSDVYTTTTTNDNDNSTEETNDCNRINTKNNRTTNITTNGREKSKVQGFNDGIMLFTIGVLQLSAASIYQATGNNWNIFNGIVMGFSLLCVIITFIKAIRTKLVVATTSAANNNNTNNNNSV